MGVAPDAMIGCLQPIIGSKNLISSTCTSYTSVLLTHHDFIADIFSLYLFNLLTCNLVGADYFHYCLVTRLWSDTSQTYL
jgi:hypothetical protein